MPTQEPNKEKEMRNIFYVPALIFGLISLWSTVNAAYHFSIGDYESAEGFIIYSFIALLACLITEKLSKSK